MDDKAQKQALEMLDRTALMLRGMTMDPAIPEHAKEAMRARIKDLEAFVTREAE